MVLYRSEWSRLADSGGYRELTRPVNPSLRCEATRRNVDTAWHSLDAGLSMAFHAAGGNGPRVAFGLLAVATLATALQGYRHIRASHVRQHREWMLRSYALIFAAVTLRLWMPALTVLVYDGQCVPAYRWAAWLAWGQPEPTAWISICSSRC